MIRINLLPHREEKRAARRRQFINLLVGTAVLSVLALVLVHGLIAARIQAQESRNKFLEGKIAELDARIAEIAKLKEQSRALIARKQVVEELQTNRSEAVHLLDELVRQLPEGVYLKSVKQTGHDIALTGYAQSNARVSTLIRNLEASPWLESPSLVQILAATVNGLRASEFSLNVRQPAPDATKDRNKKDGKA